jgi:hypothetical protein
MTTATQVEKLYQKLTPEELAGLAFEANVRGNKAEFETICTSVGNRKYLCLDQRFSRLTTAYINLGVFYGMTYWKNRTYLAYAETLYTTQGDEKSQVLLFHLLDSAVAMDIALQKVCASHGIDIMTVKKLALCDTEYAFDQSGETKLLDEYLELFNGFLD